MFVTCFPAAPALRVQIESDVYRPNKGGIERLVTHSLSVSLVFSASLSLSVRFAAAALNRFRCCGQTGTSLRALRFFRALLDNVEGLIMG